MNTCADHIVGYLFTQSCQIAILAGVVGLLAFMLRHRSAHIRYLLWLIVVGQPENPPGTREMLR